MQMSGRLYKLLTGFHLSWCYFHVFVHNDLLYLPSALGPNSTRQGILRHDHDGTTPSNFIVGEYARLVRLSQINKGNRVQLGLCHNSLCLLDKQTDIAHPMECDTISSQSAGRLSCRLPVCLLRNTTYRRRTVLCDYFCVWWFHLAHCSAYLHRSVKDHLSTWVICIDRECVIWI